MSAFLVFSLLVVAALIAVGLYRVWAGPTVFDRLVAVALVSVNGVVVLVLLGITLERPVLFFDIALGFALLAFLLPITLGRYFEARLTERQEARRAAGEPDTAPTYRPIMPVGVLARRGRKLEGRMATRIQRQAAETRTASLAKGVQDRETAAREREARDAEASAFEPPARPPEPPADAGPDPEDER